MEPVLHASDVTPTCGFVPKRTEDNSYARLASEDEDRLPAREPLEWPSSLNVEALIAAGWRPTPLRQFLIKLHSRCNLACDYCYVYTLADQTWRTKPRVISQALSRLSLNVSPSMPAPTVWTPYG